MKVTIFRKDGSKSIIKRCFCFEENMYTDVPLGSPFRFQYNFRFIANAVIPENGYDCIFEQYSVFIDDVEKIEISPAIHLQKNRIE